MANLQAPPNSTGAVIDSNLIAGNVRPTMSQGSPSLEANQMEVAPGASAQFTPNPPGWTQRGAFTGAQVATVTQPAGGGTVKNVCTELEMSIVVGANPLPLCQLVVRDGASGVGAIIWAISIQLLANEQMKTFALGGLKLIGSANTAMTFEFTANGVAGVLQSVGMQGYTLPS